MTSVAPLAGLTQFRAEISSSEIAHLVFDCPGRSMNVLCEAAIIDLQRVATWVPAADIAGLLIRSGKENAFCAGADLTELGTACDMIAAAPERARFGTAFEHFFRLSDALRTLETAGKPVAAAIAGLALGGGCELALGAHFRVAVDDPKVALGLPESLVGLLPGAGGTQRLPRLIGPEAAFPILLDGKRLSGQAALDAGVVDVLARRGEEIAIAEHWILSHPKAHQPWDDDMWRAPPAQAIGPVVESARSRVLAETLGHYPAPLAILDCVEFGLPQTFEGAIRTEMAIFAELIQRSEPRNMIHTMFLGKADYDRTAREGALSDKVVTAVARLGEEIAVATAGVATLRLAGFGRAGEWDGPERARFTRGYWIDEPEASEARVAIEAIVETAMQLSTGLTSQECRMADYALVKNASFPAYLGGPFALGVARRTGRRTEGVGVS